MEEAPVLACAGLRKAYGDRVAVDDVSFQIHPGETYGLLGPNGAGKTTTISMVCGLLQRDAGDVHLEGRPLDTRSVDVKAMVGFVPQELALYPDLTAKENMRFFGSLYGLRGAELDRRIGRILETVGLTDRADDRSGSYSGGMKRRLNIGLGLLNEPKLLLLDEPTVGVDPQSRNAILDAVDALSDEGMAVLYTTHYMEEAERLCDRVGILDEGTLKAEGSRRELVARVGEHDRLQIGAVGDLQRAAQAAREVAGVVQVDVTDEGLELIVTNARGSLAALIQAVDTVADISSVEVTEPNLEAVFLHLTGKALRDEG